MEKNLFLPNNSRVQKYDNIQWDYYACHALLCWKCSSLHTLHCHFLEVTRKESGQVRMPQDRNRFLYPPWIWELPGFVFSNPRLPSWPATQATSQQTLMILSAAGGPAVSPMGPAGGLHWSIIIPLSVSSRTTIYLALYLKTNLPLKTHLRMNYLRQQQGCPEHVGIPPRSWWTELGEGRLDPSDQIQISI